MLQTEKERRDTEKRERRRNRAGSKPSDSVHSVPPSSNDCHDDGGTKWTESDALLGGDINSSDKDSQQEIQRQDSVSSASTSKANDPRDNCGEFFLSIFRGFWLIVSSRYVLCLFFIHNLHYPCRAILDYSMSLMLADVYPYMKPDDGLSLRKASRNDAAADQRFWLMAAVSLITPLLSMCAGLLSLEKFLRVCGGYRTLLRLTPAGLFVIMTLLSVSYFTTEAREGEERRRTDPRPVRMKISGTAPDGTTSLVALHSWIQWNDQPPEGAPNQFLGGRIARFDPERAECLPWSGPRSSSSTLGRGEGVISTTCAGVEGGDEHQHSQSVAIYPWDEYVDGVDVPGASFSIDQEKVRVHLPSSVVLVQSPDPISSAPSIAACRKQCLGDKKCRYSLWVPGDVVTSPSTTISMCGAATSTSPFGENQTPANGFCLRYASKNDESKKPQSGFQVNAELLSKERAFLHRLFHDKDKQPNKLADEFFDKLRVLSRQASTTSSAAVLSRLRFQELKPRFSFQEVARRAEQAGAGALVIALPTERLARDRILNQTSEEVWDRENEQNQSSTAPTIITAIVDWSTLGDNFGLYNSPRTTTPEDPKATTTPVRSTTATVTTLSLERFPRAPESGLTQALRKFFSFLPRMSHLGRYLLTAVPYIFLMFTIWTFNAPLLNNLFMRTSPEVRLHAQSWMKNVGVDLIKLCGHGFNLLVNIPFYQPVATWLLATVICVFWAFLCIPYAVSRFHELEEKDIVDGGAEGAEDEEEDGSSPRLLPLLGRTGVVEESGDGGAGGGGRGRGVIEDPAANDGTRNEEGRAGRRRSAGGAGAGVLNTTNNQKVLGERHMIMVSAGVRAPEIDGSSIGEDGDHDGPYAAAGGGAAEDHFD